MYELYIYDINFLGFPCSGKSSEAGKQILYAPGIPSIIWVASIYMLLNHFTDAGNFETIFLFVSLV